MECMLMIGQWGTATGDSRPRSIAQRLWSLIQRQPRWWRRTALGLTAAYGLLIILVMAGWPLANTDAYFYHLQIIRPGSHWQLLGAAVVFVGQRFPASIVAGWFAIHRARVTGKWYPVTYFLLAEVLFVGSVLFVKITTGRIGPRYTNDVLAVWQGGDIFPSGHVTGAVVLYGLIAMLAARTHQAILAIAAAGTSLAVAAATVAINTHWVTDAIGGLLCGVLVLLATWALGPTLERRRAALWHRISLRHHTRVIRRHTASALQVHSSVATGSGGAHGMQVTFPKH